MATGMTVHEVEGLRPGWWMTCRAWMDPLDEDRKHVVMLHDCTVGRVESTLPWPTWRAEGNAVVPSFSCDVCRVHTLVELGEAPDETERLLLGIGG